MATPSGYPGRSRRGFRPTPKSAIRLLDASIAVGMLIAEHPPAQIPACVFHAPGSQLGYSMAKRALSQG